MRILILAPQNPYPPRQGTSLRNYHILLGLSRHHNVSLLTFGEETSVVPVHEGLAFCETIHQVKTPARSFSQRILNLFMSRQADMVNRLESSLYDRKLEDLLRGQQFGNNKSQPFDIVQVEGLELAGRIPLIRRISPQSKILFDNHNAETELQRRAMATDLSSPLRWPMAVYSWVQTRRLERYEAEACRAADWVTAVSDTDRHKLEELAPGTKVTVVPNCIDLIGYQKKSDDPEITYDIVFIGKMDYRPNVDAVLWFARRIWPRIQEKRPQTTWAIVGQKPHKRLNWVRKLNNVFVSGWVDRIQPYLFGASIMVMPFRIGSGTRLKLIEAMASGKATVSTTVGAEGYPVSHGKELLIANKPGDFAESVLTLLDDPERRATLGKNARCFAESYDWRRIIPRFDEIYAGF